jgi:hypothetical protein
MILTVAVPAGVSRDQRCVGVEQLSLFIKAVPLLRSESPFCPERVELTRKPVFQAHVPDVARAMPARVELEWMPSGSGRPGRTVIGST